MVFVNPYFTTVIYTLFCRISLGGFLQMIGAPKIAFYLSGVVMGNYFFHPEF